MNALTLSKKGQYDLFSFESGQNYQATWTPVKVRRGLGLTVKAKPKPSNFPWLSSDALVFDTKAVNLLADVLNKNGELLPLDVEDGSELFVFNSQVIDALDIQNSEIKYVPKTDRIMLVKSACFFEEKLVACDVFRLPHRSSVTYVSEYFVNRVKEAGLVGLTFIPQAIE